MAASSRTSKQSNGGNRATSTWRRSFVLPEGWSQTSLEKASPELFDPQAVGRRYGVHAFFVQLNGVEPELVVEQCTYWNSLWSHRRNGQWKGYLQVDLAPAGDREAMANLDLMSNE